MIFCSFAVNNGTILYDIKHKVGHETCALCPHTCDLHFYFAEKIAAIDLTQLCHNFVYKEDYDSDEKDKIITVNIIHSVPKNSANPKGTFSHNIDKKVADNGSTQPNILVSVGTSCFKLSKEQ